jgi:putative spermidine/putrescine transport system ATP-binding protein
VTESVVSEAVAVESRQLAPSTPAVQLVGLRKRFGDIDAVDGIDLSIADGEFFALLGPSGSGKTTVLRMIAGFERPTAGAVLLHGHDVSHVPAYDRDVNTVFQDYALFPHMTVLQNVEYGLKVKGVAKAERRRRALEMLETVRLGQFGGRKPNQLSGGQRQRIALARALVNKPRVLLLDEPLGALDLKLREEMQVELKTIQHTVGITFIFVTHDQSEALSMSDRVAVFHNGRIEQVGTPRDVYERPQTPFVANFVGTSNLLTGELAGAGNPAGADGTAGQYTVRPERIAVNPPSIDTDSDISVSGRVVDIQYLGADSRVRVRLPDGSHLIASVPSDGLAGLQVGSDAVLSWPRSAAFRVAD